MTRQGCSESGFTLMELIAVLVIVGLLAVFIPLALDSIVAERELDAEASRLVNEIELLVRQSMIDQAKYAIWYDTNERRWAVQRPIEVRQEDPNDSDEEVTVLVLEEDPDEEELQWHNLPDSFRFQLWEGSNRIESNTYRVIFEPRGTVAPHALVLISEKISTLNDDERARTVKVNFPGFVSTLPGIRTEDFKKTASELGR